MVTRLTSYTKQRYVTNSGEDPGDIVFRNGDTVFLMDTQQEIIYSEENNQWYQVPSVSGSTLITKTITANGTYNASADNADGYSSVTVDVQGGRTKMLGTYYINNDGASGIGDVLYLENYCPNAALQAQATVTNVGHLYDIDVKGENIGIPVAAFNTSTNANAVRKITCEETPNIRMMLLNNAQVFRGCSELTEIHPLLDFSQLPGAFNRVWDNNGGIKLTHVRCIPNTAEYGLMFNNSSLLDDASLVSIANALKNGSATITLHATSKTKCSTIVGNVSSVTDDTGTYDFFTADPNGTVTLTEFITITKGWTLA